MARTFRIRHLPRFGIAKHFAWTARTFAREHRQALGELMVPILSPHWHPAVRYRANVQANVFYRRVAHKNMRRVAKHLLNRSGRDFDEMLMPLWREHFDTWNFT